MIILPLKITVNSVKVHHIYHSKQLCEHKNKKRRPASAVKLYNDIVKSKYTSDTIDDRRTTTDGVSAINKVVTPFSIFRLEQLDCHPYIDDYKLNVNPPGQEVVIDELQLCFNRANSLSVYHLEHVEKGVSVTIEEYEFVRGSNDRFKYYFSVYDKQKECVATLKFGRFAGERGELAYFRVENPVLYNPNKLNEVLRLPFHMHMELHNITTLDLAYDSPRNMYIVIRRKMCSKTTETIINDKVIVDRTSLIRGVDVCFSVSTQKLMYPTITIRQKKAIRNKYKGVTVQAYNKKEEIEHKSNKYYILERYGNPQHLHRLEVRIHNEQIKEFLQNRQVDPIVLINNPELLKDMFLCHLGRVIKFKSNNKLEDWKALLRMH